MSYTLWQNILILIGRILFSAIFIAAGIDKILHFNTATSYMINHNVPMAGIVVIIVLVIEILAGLAVLAGFRTRWFAGLLLLLVLLFTILFQSYGSVSLTEVQVQFRHWITHFAVIAAALYIIAFGAGRFSIENRTK